MFLAKTDRRIKIGLPRQKIDSENRARMGQCGAMIGSCVEFKTLIINYIFIFGAKKKSKKFGEMFFTRVVTREILKLHLDRLLSTLNSIPPQPQRRANPKLCGAFYLGRHFLLLLFFLLLKRKVTSRWISKRRSVLRKIAS